RGDVLREWEPLDRVEVRGHPQDRHLLLDRPATAATTTLLPGGFGGQARLHNHGQRDPPIPREKRWDERGVDHRGGLTIEGESFRVKRRIVNAPSMILSYPARVY
ncbi:MAG: hypothetical protein DRO12_03970, partial [Thermoprotei archaeon]